jgi:hypothetical protein
MHYIWNINDYDTNNETTLALRKAVELANVYIDTSTANSQLGEGWIAEEALAIAVYRSLKETIEPAHILSVLALTLRQGKSEEMVITNS